MEERYQMRVLGVDSEGGRVAYAVQLPSRPNGAALVRYRQTAQQEFWNRYPNAEITSIKRVAMGPREEQS